MLKITDLVITTLIILYKIRCRIYGDAINILNSDSIFVDKSGNSYTIAPKSEITPIIILIIQARMILKMIGDIISKMNSQVELAYLYYKLQEILV